MTKQTVTNESRLKNIEARLKIVEDILELSNTITSFDWKDFSIRDRSILKQLYTKNTEGATTVELATALNFTNISSGRTIIYRRLRRIEAISRRIKGLPIVIAERKKWYLNTNDFQFKIVEVPSVESTN